MADASLAREVEGICPVELLADEESALVQRARQGDMRAFDAIIVRYEARLLRFLASLVGDGEVARELCQDTFLAAYQALPRLKGDLRLSAWLHTIALNRARSYHRKRRLRRAFSLQDGHGSRTEPDVGEYVAAQDAVQRTLAKLPHKYTYPLLLQVAGGLSCREIGETLGCSEGAVKVRLLRAREAFRRAYEQEGG